MARRSGGRRLAISLLLALFASAAANTPELAYREARVLYDRGDWTTLVATTSDALARFGDGDPNILAKLRVLHAAGLLPTAPKIAAESIGADLPPELRDSEVAVIRLRVLAIAAHIAKNDKEGLQLIEAARRLALAKHPQLAAEMTVGLVNFKMSSSLPEAEHWAREAVRLAVRHPLPRSEVAARAALGRVLGLEERYDEAIAMNEHALALARANHLDVLEQQIVGNLGWLSIDLGDSDLAEEYVNAALASATKLGMKRDLVTWHQQLGNIALDRESFGSAAAEYRTALALATEQKMPRGAALANLATIALRTKNYPAARDYNAQAMAAKHEAGDEDGVLRSTILEAHINRETNHLDDAQRALAQVLAESKSRFIRFEAESELARVALARNDPETEKQFLRALSTIDDARAELTKDELKLAFPNVTASLYYDYVDFLATAGRSRDALRAVEQSRARTLAEGLGARAGARDFDPEALAKRANVTVLSYWLAPQRSYLFVVTPQGVEQVVLPEAGVINASVDAYQKDLNNTRRGSGLYTMLVAPAVAAIRGRRIAIIPDGHLAVFNFETLVTPKGHYWIEDVTIESAPALEFVAGAKKSRPGRLLLVGNAPQADPQYPPLPHAAEEIADVEKYFEHPTTLAGSRATPLAYTKAAPESYAYVHFVAHGVATRQRPLDSAIILGRDANGYKLYARDIMAHHLRARLVTISSCHGAGRRAFAGEGLVGLAWAFLFAGAHEVVAALWEVDDKSTVQLMDTMYDAIHAGQPPADALRAAKLKLLHSRTIFQKPRYWAPFVLYSGS